MSRNFENEKEDLVFVKKISKHEENDTKKRSTPSFGKNDDFKTSSTKIKGPFISFGFDDQFFASPKPKEKESILSDIDECSFEREYNNWDEDTTEMNHIDIIKKKQKVKDYVFFE